MNVVPTSRKQLASGSESQISWPGDGLATWTMSPSSRNVEPRNCRAFADGQLIALRLKRVGQRSTSSIESLYFLLLQRMSSAMASDKQPIWTPPDPSSARIHQFSQRVADKYKVPLHDYWQFWKWSAENVGPFWDEVWDECGIIGDKGPKGPSVSSDDPLYPPPHWFPGSRVNFAENMLRNHAHPELKDEPAVISTFEADSPRAKFSDTTLTHAQLYQQVAQAVEAFRKVGVKKGDVVASTLR